mmetsp:Transcript_44151/g.126412  ORF Transcript_44151/g.126412 Transcript_44151/m.126412 type:complete len:298 (+) Transcript_44151:141-1034(+)
MGDESRIWIGGLPDTITEKAIKDEYDKYGSIKHIQIRCNRGSPAFAFVQYSDRRDAEDAVKGTDQQKLFGMPFVKVSWAGKGTPRGKGKGKGKNRSRSRGRRSGSRSRSPRRSPSRRDSRQRSRQRSRSPPRRSRSRSPPARRKDSNERSSGGDRRDDRRSPSYQQGGPRGSRSRDGRPPPGRSRSGGGGGRGRSPSGGQRRQQPGWYQPKPSEVQGKYRMKIERLPEDMGWQELKGLGSKMAKVGQCTFSRTNRDRTGVLEFTSREDMDRAISELDGRRFSGSEERVKAYEERNSR